MLCYTCNFYWMESQITFYIIRLDSFSLQFTICLMQFVSNAVWINFVIYWFGFIPFVGYHLGYLWTFYLSNSNLINGNMYVWCNMKCCNLEFFVQMLGQLLRNEVDWNWNPQLRVKDISVDTIHIIYFITLLEHNVATYKKNIDCSLWRNHSGRNQSTCS
jgi:hypothetical protein